MAAARNGQTARQHWAASATRDTKAKPEGRSDEHGRAGEEGGSLCEALAHSESMKSTPTPAIPPHFGHADARLAHHTRDVNAGVERDVNRVTLPGFGQVRIRCCLSSAEYARAAVSSPRGDRTRCYTAVHASFPLTHHLLFVAPFLILSQGPSPGFALSLHRGQCSGKLSRFLYCPRIPNGPLLSRYPPRPPLGLLHPRTGRK